MKAQETKPYMRPQSTLTVVRLENPICTGSEYGTNTDKDLETTTTDHQVNTSFKEDNNFSTGSWD